MMKAEYFLNMFSNVHKVPYNNNELLYNILLDEYTTVNVNGLICETLHPNNIIAQIYKTLSVLDSNEQLVFLHLINEYARKEHINVSIVSKK